MDLIQFFLSTFWLQFDSWKVFHEKTNYLSTRWYKCAYRRQYYYSTTSFIQVTKSTYDSIAIYILRARLCPELLAVDATCPASSSLLSRLLCSSESLDTLTGIPSDQGRWAAPTPHKIAFPFTPFFRASLVAWASKDFFKDTYFSRAKGFSMSRGRTKMGTCSCDSCGFK